jgi:hypothetical protein
LGVVEVEVRRGVIRRRGVSCRTCDDLVIMLWLTEYYHLQTLIEQLFDEYAAESDLSSSDIFAACRDVMDDKFTALFEENEHKWFVELLMSWMGFDDFMKKVHKTKKSRDRSKNSRK